MQPNMRCHRDRTLNLDQLRSELDDEILAMSVGDQYSMLPQTESLHAVEELLHELGRRGAAHAIELGYVAISRLVTHILLRTEARLNYAMRVQSRMNNEPRRLDLPIEGVGDVAKLLAALTRIHTQVSDHYVKFRRMQESGTRGAGGEATRAKAGRRGSSAPAGEDRTSVLDAKPARSGKQGRPAGEQPPSRSEPPATLPRPERGAA